MLARRPAPYRIALAALLILAVLIQTNGQASSYAPPHQAPTFRPHKDKSVPGVTAKPVPADHGPADEHAARTAPTPVWPQPGSADVAVPAGTPGTRAPAFARAGALPVSLAATGTSADHPGRVRIAVLGRQGNDLLLRAARSDGSTRSGRVTLQVDYSGFRAAFGGDWATRLHLVQLPACALTTPDVAGCVGTALPTRNNGTGVLSADVPIGPADQVFAVQAGASGPAGDYAASSLSPSATWTVGNSSGDFNWSYPMDAPPSNGPTPKLSIDYSSGSVDGRTSATNNQVSLVGSGFDLGVGGSIERRYANCASKSEQAGNNGTKDTGDMCWATDNATLSLNGSGGELVRDDASKTWHPRVDDGTKVERLTGAVNGDDGSTTSAGTDKGEYWKVTTKDGTQYFFGLNHLPGWSTGRPVTNSAWTAPVFGNNPDEPCHQTAFATSWCDQAYRWNLDYVVDPHGNTMSLYYDVETDHYARNMTDTTVSTYVRSGNIARIEYGQADPTVYTTQPSAKVLFTTAERCTGTCTTKDYPDTPLDLSCASTTNCKNHYYPSFWTRKRLAKITTQVNRGATSFGDVESWTFRHIFKDTGDGTSPALWLDGVTDAGLVGGSVATPELQFSGVLLANRVDGLADGMPPLNWWRISAISYPTGGELAVTYSPADCQPGQRPAPDTNNRRCYPMKWTPAGQAERQDWFHKYVVTDVTESDRITGLEPVATHIDYLTPPAWHYDEEDGLVQIDRKTWSQWRGYGLVRVTKGSPGGPQTVTEQRYFRGMNGDPLANGGQLPAAVTDSTGTSVPDDPALNSQLREKISYDGDTMIDRSIADKWVSQPTATRVRSWGTTRSYMVHDGAIHQDRAVDGGWLHNANSNTFDAHGVLLQANVLNDPADAKDDTCTRYQYATNPTLGIAELKAHAQTVSVSCDKTWTNADVIDDERVYYDNATTAGAPPTKGDATKGERLSGFDAAGQPTYQTVFTAAYDSTGRPTGYTDALSRTTRTGYVPAGVGPQTRKTVTQPNGNQTITDYDPAWGAEVSNTTPDGRHTDTAYDPLGRKAKVWLPGRNKATDVPDTEYGYQMRTDGPGVVTTKKLQADGSIDTSYELTDGLQRVRQTQEPAPGGGRILTDTFYDSRGLDVKENGPYYNDAPPNTERLIPPVDAAMPTQTVMQFDAAERPTAQILRSQGKDLAHTGYTSSANQYTTEPPDGDQATTKIFDTEGRLAQLRQFAGNTATGSYDKTSYTYTPSGQLATVTDPAGNVSRFEYDVRNRKISETSPDKGRTTYTYDDADQITSTTDARGSTLAYRYDANGRRTEEHLGSVDGPMLAGWTYDALAKGQLSSSTRYVDGNPYTTRVTGYDYGGRPTGYEYVIPSAEGALSGTYAFGMAYRANGQLATESLPAAGDLPTETLTHGYNGNDLPTTLSSDRGNYVTDTEYTPFGETSLLTMGQTGGKWVQNSYEYDLGTRRLNRILTERQTLPRKVSDVTYGYDPAGNITKATDTPGTGEPTDTQCYQYDQDRRLTSAWTPGSGDCTADPSVATLGGPAPYWDSWTFDSSGDRTSQTQRSPSGTSSTTYDYPAVGSANPHAVQQATTTNASGTTVDKYGYDQTGNLNHGDLGGHPESLSWDAEGHLAGVDNSAGTTSYLYDADGNRLLRRDPSGTTLYLGQTELLLKPDGSEAGTRYYAHGDKTVAVRTGGRVTWLVADAQGNPRLAIDATTQDVQRHRTDPYGNQRGPAPATWPGQRDFANGTADPSTGLVHLGAREYDPRTGRFISVDPVVDTNDPQQLNGYSYANNNPVTYTDSDGHNPVVLVVAIPIVVIVLAVVVTIYLLSIPEVREHIVTVVNTVVDWAVNWTGPNGLFNTLVTVVRVVHWFETVYRQVKEAVTTWVKQTIKRFVNRTVQVNSVASGSGKDESQRGKSASGRKGNTGKGNTNGGQNKGNGGGGNKGDPPKNPDKPRPPVPPNVRVFKAPEGSTPDSPTDVPRIPRIGDPIEEPWVPGETTDSPLRVRRTAELLRQVVQTISHTQPPPPPPPWIPPAHF